jgi:hypothetical protein
VEFTKGAKDEKFVISFDAEKDQLVATVVSKYSELMDTVATATSQCHRQGLLSAGNTYRHLSTK